MHQWSKENHSKSAGRLHSIHFRRIHNFKVHGFYKEKERSPKQSFCQSKWKPVQIIKILKILNTLQSDSMWIVYFWSHNNCVRWTWHTSLFYKLEKSSEVKWHPRGYTAGLRQKSLNIQADGIWHLTRKNTPQGILKTLLRDSWVIVNCTL